MAGKTMVLLDGSGPGDGDLKPTLEILRQVLKVSGAEVKLITLREMKLAHCLGCFNCWVKTPGMCVESDEGRGVAKTVIQSDATVLFTPVTFGGYSPELKKLVDHFIQLISPFFEIEHGEMHHPPRYAHRPRLMVVGVQREYRNAEAKIFKTLAGRNAINLHPPSYAVEVVESIEDPNTLRRHFQELLTREDALPFGEAAATVMPAPVLASAVLETGITRRALLIVGSPKTTEPSTSSALGSFVLDRLDSRGWDVETLTLRAKLNRPEGRSELMFAVEQAGLIVLAFPLYADSLPYLMTKALTVIGARKRPEQLGLRKRLVAIVNSGFPETHQNAVALAICREFAGYCGFSWAGGLAFGGGGMIGGQPLLEANRPGPPVRQVVTTLELTAAALAAGQPVPMDAISMTMRKPLPFAAWSRLYAVMASRSFRKLAAKNGIPKEKLMAQPYAA
jgi:multimeric flavodoxin WrbA